MPNTDQLYKLLVQLRLTKDVVDYLVGYIMFHRIHKGHHVTLRTHFYRGLTQSNEKDRRWAEYIHCSDVILKRDPVTGEEVEIAPDERLRGYWVAITVNSHMTLVHLGDRIKSVIPFTHHVNSKKGFANFYYEPLTIKG